MRLGLQELIWSLVYWQENHLTASVYTGITDGIIINNLIICYNACYLRIKWITVR